MDAIVLGNALSYVQPAKDQAQSAQKHKAWMKFLNSLDIEKISTPISETKKDSRSFLSMFARVAVPITKQKT